MKNILNSSNTEDFLILLMSIKEKKPITLYYDNYALFNGCGAQEELMRVLALANFTEVQIIIQRNQAIENGDAFWKSIDNLCRFLRAVSEPLRLRFQTGDITPVVPEGPDSGSQKTIFIKLRPNDSIFSA